ncbi:peptide ABC transporter substrate-binding protein [Chthonobacter rhizosphaerae]|uniref:peptide ABC transporter substrate-binding protein n=1 Tax=Chthonobacter rhizosphaerae TaxID=2735553 RepID=UPI0015EEB4C2|nr:peptide ABC transporter substrate-binding protein [Chthonobacter rhizosphaerae]
MSVAFLPRAFVAALLAGSMLAAAVAPAAAEVVYNRGNDGDPETLDPQLTSTVAEMHIMKDLFETLVVYNQKAEPIPGAATSWTTSLDGRTWTFKLRDGATWSNGDPVTATDFVFAWRRILNPETGAEYASMLYPIKGALAYNKGEGRMEDVAVTAIDDKTLEVVLDGPTPYFVEMLTHQATVPLHEASVSKLGAEYSKPGNMITNGAYTLVSATPGDKVVLAKNPKFHDAANVQIDTVNYIPFEDRAACVRRFEAGEIDSCSDLPADQMAQLREKFGDQVRTPPYLGTYYFPIKTDKPPFNDPKVRRALDLAIDREFLADEIWSGTMLPAYSFVPPGTANYENGPTSDFKDMSQLDREDEAKKLIEEAGFGPGKPLKIEISYNTSENHKNTSTAIADMWKTVLGAEVTMTSRDAATHYAYLRQKGDYDVARAGWIADYNDAESFLGLMKSNNPGFNYANYSNPEFDKIMAESYQEGDLAKRSEILKEAEKIILRDTPNLALLYYSSHTLYSPKLTGWEDNIMNVYPTRFLKLQK